MKVFSTAVHVCECSLGTGMFSATRYQPESLETLLGAAKPFKHDKISLISDLMLALSHERIVKKCTLNPELSKIKPAAAIKKNKKYWTLLLSQPTPCNVIKT